MQGINNWFANHTDAILVTDKVNTPKEFAEQFIDKKRLMMELFSEEAIDEALRNSITPIISECMLYDLSINNIDSLKKKNVQYMAFSRRFIKEHLSFVKELKRRGLKAYVFHIGAIPHTHKSFFMNEDYVLKYEMPYIYGFYADNWIGDKE